MSFFNELKRRNVFRVGIAYTVGAWLVLQVSDIVFEAIGTPPWVMQTLLVVLAIGLLATLFFAWAFELTPEGIKREREVDRSQSIAPQTGRKLDRAIIALLVVGMAYFIWESRFSRPAGEQSTGHAQTAEATRPEAVIEADPEIRRASIAVLPFTNRSRNADDEPFVEGVHDDLLTNLARIGELKVISRTSVLRYKDTEQPIPDIARELGVSTIMEGAVQRSGDTVRINVQLIDAQTDEHLWAEIFDRELTAENLFAIQSEISQKIADALQATLTDDERQRINTMPTDNLAAYDAYVRGRQLMATRESSKLEQAAGEFLEAVELDPDFALAWVGVADAHRLWNNYGSLSWEDSLRIQEDAIGKALAIDEQLGEAYVSRATLLADRREFEAAEADFKRGIELSPNYATAYHWYSVMLSRFKLRNQERTQIAIKAVELDPRSAIVGVALGAAYFDQGLYVRAERQLLKVLELEPGHVIALAMLARMYERSGRLAEAMSYARKGSEQDPGSLRLLQTQAFVYLRLDEPEKAEALLARLEEMNPENIGNGYVSLWIAKVRGNRPAARESAQWLVPREEKEGAPLYFMGFEEAIDGNHEAALDYFVRSDPRWLEPDAWPELVRTNDDLGCWAGWLLLMNGRPEQGLALLDETLRFLTQELPAADEHADRNRVEFCYLAKGDIEGAYKALETRLAHNHLGLWREAVKTPFYEPIRHDERLNELLAEHDRRIAVQRELVAKMDEGLAL